ncbi:MAG: YceI family protein [Alphaproteobacteria bacterium]|nr:YceI family protein [Alphaproteobacteria bacterium]
MKKILRTGLFAASLLVSPLAHAADTYTLDASHTAVTWTISHFDFSHPWGKFAMIDGSLTLDEKNPANSKLSVTVPMDHIVTGVDKLDEHLKSDAFFDVAKYPTSTFTSTKVTVTGKDTATVEGNLTMHGVTRPETLEVKLNKLGENMMKKKTAGFSATATVKRSDFGITQYLPMLGDEVKLYIECEANI